MTTLITGAAGFIGFNLCKRILEDGHPLIGLDNLNSYYDPNLKISRIRELEKISRKTGNKFKFIKGDLHNNDEIKNIFRISSPTKVVNLAAQAGVRYSIFNPDVYFDSN